LMLQTVGTARKVISLAWCEMIRARIRSRKTRLSDQAKWIYLHSCAIVTVVSLTKMAFKGTVSLVIKLVLSAGPLMVLTFSSKFLRYSKMYI
jgi:hypothetical protein